MSWFIRSIARGFTGSDLTQLRDERNWDPRTGWRIDRPWVGSPFQVDAKITALQAAKIPFTHHVSPVGGYEIVVAHFGADRQDDLTNAQPTSEELADRWELLGNDLEKDIWTLPRVRQLWGNHLDPATLLWTGGIDDPESPDFPTFAAIKADIQALLDGSKTISVDDVPWWFNPIPGIDQTLLKLFVRALLRGETSYTVSQFVIRNTKTVATNYDVKPDYSRVNKLMRAADIEGFYNPPSTILFNLPDVLWVERTPQLEQIAAEKFTLTREWWGVDNADPLIYQYWNAA